LKYLGEERGTQEEEDCNFVLTRIRDSAAMIEECIFRTLLTNNVRTSDVHGQHKTSEFVNALIADIKEQMRVKSLTVKKA